jgi:hypothetical protein
MKIMSLSVIIPTGILWPVLALRWVTTKCIVLVTAKLFLKCDKLPHSEWFLV